MSHLSKKVIRTATVPESLNNLLKGQLSYLNQYFDIVAVSSDGKDLKEVEQRERVRTSSVKMYRRISPFYDFVSLIKLFFLFRRQKPKIVHSITPKAGLLSMLAGKMAGVPVRIHTFTGLVFPIRIGFVQKLLINTDRLLCWASTNIYPEGEGVKNDLINYKITSKPLKVVANGNVNGIDTTYFSSDNFSNEQKQSLKKSLHITEDDFVYIFVGRLVGDKGINELVEVFDEISQDGKKKLLLVGSQEKELDPLQSKTLSIIEKNKNIIAVGFQKDVRAYFTIADCLVFPSYREGFPNVVMQAGAMELPSIVSDINGCNEIIENQKNGLIIPSKQKKLLQEKMLLISQDEKLYHFLKQNSREMIVSRYEQQVVWEAILKEYKKLSDGI